MNRRLTFAIFVVVVAVVTFMSLRGATFKPWSEVQLQDFVSEVAIVFLATGWIVCLHSFRLTRRVFRLLFIGCLFLVLAGIEDVLDEFLHDETVSMQVLENVGFPVGVLLVSMGVFRWGVEQRRSQRELLALSETDTLTGLGNRSAFDHQLREWADAEGRRALMVLDVDDFKPINDTYGHAVGDEVIRYLASVIHDNLRDRDQAFRYGGEEFVVLLANPSPEALARIAERIMAKFSGHGFAGNGGGQFSRTVSVGVAHTEEPIDPLRWFETADQLLYAAKAAGKNRVEIEIL